MNRVTEWLRRGDPLAPDSQPDGVDRARVRDAMLKASAVAPEPSRHRHGLLLALAIAAAVAVVAGSSLLTRVWNAVEVPAFAAVRVEVRLAEEAPAPGLTAAPVGQDGRVVYLHEEAILTNDGITACEVVPGSAEGRYGVEFRFTPEASRRLREATRAHIGRPVAVLLDGRVIVAPVVRSEIGDLGVLSGNYDHDAAERIARGVMLDRGVR
jgi:preprotein translocase subunit SecD